MPDEPRVEIDILGLPKETLVALVLHMQTREHAVNAINNMLISRLNNKRGDEASDILNEWSRVMIDMDEASTRKKSEIIAGSELPVVAH